jgi:hypothetical protein
LTQLPQLLARSLDTWPQADLTVVDLTLDPASPGPRQAINAAITVANIGDLAGRGFIDLLLSAACSDLGSVLQSLDITLAPGERRTLRTTFVAPAQGANVLAARVMLSPVLFDVMPQSDRNINNDTVARFIGPEPRPSRPCFGG